MRRTCPFILAILIAFLCPACAHYSQKIEQSILSYESGQMEKARDTFQSTMKGSRDAHLLQLEKGMCDLSLGHTKVAVSDFTVSINSFDRLMKGSRIRQGASFILDDAVRDYVGAPYEVISARIFLGLAYLLMSDHFEDVSAACYNLDDKMEQIEFYYERSYPFDGRGHASNFSFQIPPLGKYFAALAAERRGELDNAGIYMRQAVSGMPSCGYFREEASRMKRSRKDNLVFVFALVGMAPRKQVSVSRELTALTAGIRTLYAATDPKHRLNDVALQTVLTSPVKIPGYPKRVPFWHRGFSVKPSEDNRGVRTQVVADFDQYAREEHKTLLPGILMRAAVRRLIKEVAVHAAAEQVKDQDLKLLTRTFTGLALTQTERVDTRSWTTLPREVHAASLSVSSGCRSLVVTAETLGGGRLYPDITVPIDVSQPGPTFIVIIHPSKRARPIVFVDESHRPKPAGDKNVAR